VNVVSVLPREVEEALAEFLAAGRNGQFILHVTRGSVQAYEERLPPTPVARGR
jgi:hypothetical protein